MTMRWWLCVAAALLAVPALAQAPGPTKTNNIVAMPPNGILTPDCTFASWTLTGVGTATVSLIGPPAKPDASPGAIVTAGPTRTGNVVAVQISPDQGCGATGCRNGNSYLIELRADAGADHPICMIRVDVRKVVA